MISLPLQSVIKDWLILISAGILLLCILEIRKLKKSIAYEIQRRLIPQLALELVTDTYAEDRGFYLKNESFFLAQDIKIETISLYIEDFGIKMNYILSLKSPEMLKPQEKVKLEIGVFNKNREYLSDITEKIIPHLITANFKVVINYTNIEGIGFHIVFAKKRDKFYIARIEPTQ